jgi:hypothetical protein
VRGGTIARRGSWRTSGDFIGMLCFGPFFGFTYKAVTRCYIIDSITFRIIVTKWTISKCSIGHIDLGMLGGILMSKNYDTTDS